MNSFAIIRHKKIKDGRHLVAAGLHNARGIPTPNADKDAPPIQIMVGTHKPWRDVKKRLGMMEIGAIRANGNVAIEVFLGASPDWWKANGWTPGVAPTEAFLSLVEEWKKAQLAYLYKRFGKHLVASVVFHRDEASPHIHALVVPAQYRQDGREKGKGGSRLKWRLSTEKVLPGPAAMKAIVTEYAEAMKSFGLIRGQDRPTGTSKHKPLKQWQHEQDLLCKSLGTEILKQISMTENAAIEAERIKREAQEYAAKIKRDADKAAKEAQELIVMRIAQQRRNEDSTNAIKLEIKAEHQRAADFARTKEKELVALQHQRGKLEAMIAKVEAMLLPIRSYADRWAKASPLLRQGIGPKGAEAAAMAPDEDMHQLNLMRAFLNSRGGAGR